MATILNIETSGKICSVALSRDGAVEYQLEDLEGMNHAEKLAPFVDKCMDEAHKKGWTLDAVAVSIGPGSYTGLRIGLSLAKGLCFGSGIPLIAVPTLMVLAVKAMFMPRDWTGEEILVPMLDARRMEVYTAAYDFALNEVITARPLILDEESYAELPAGRRAVFFGNGSDKYSTLAPDAYFIEGLEPHARDMIALSEKYFREGKFSDVAYSVPLYLKEYRTTKPKSRLNI